MDQGRPLDEQRLRALNQALRVSARVIESMPDQVAVVDRQYIYRMVNPRFALMHGRPVEQIVGHTVAQVLGEDVFHYLRPFVDRALAGETLNYEGWFLYPDIGRRYMQVHYSPLPDDHEIECVVAILHDLTERKQAEAERESLLAEVQRERSRLRAVFQALPDLYFRMDAEGTILDFYAGRPADLYLPPPEFLGRRMYDVLPAAIGKQYTQAVEEVLKGGSPVTIDYPLLLPGGEADFEARLLLLPDKQIIAVVRNVTEERRSRQSIEQLAESAQRQASELQGVVASMVDGVIVSSVEGRITHANAAALRLLGVGSISDIQRPLSEMIPLFQIRRPDGTALAPAEMAMARALRGETVPLVDQQLRNRQTQAKVYVRASAAPIRDQRGGVIGAVTILRDVTELIELEQMKDQFVAVAAHELKTPVSIMKGYAQLLLRSPGDLSPLRRRMLEAIDRGSDRIDRIVRDLLDISRLHVGEIAVEREPIDLPGLVEQTVNETILTSGRSIKIISAEPALVQGDRERLKQVLANLLDNAIKYSPEEGDVKVSVTRRDGEAVVSVRDHGIGIPKEKHQHIFERFYRAHTGTPHDYGGMGVGLYISQQIIQRHGGRIWFESEEGKGSTFHFSLPLKND